MLLNLLVALFSCQRRHGVVPRGPLRDVSFALLADPVVPNVAAIGLDMTRGCRPAHRG